MMNLEANFHVFMNLLYLFLSKFQTKLIGQKTFTVNVCGPYKTPHFIFSGLKPGKKMPVDQITYSEKYFDDLYEYRYR